ncbi:hypothetical protein QE152_g29720 [Popillia japonica]|uniref:Uncharacterized protein n=1 Tax=Popillia japonica TaxID=7064 RepID=A0AAW1JG45_POPJA
MCTQKTTTGQAAIKRPKWSLFECLSFLDSVPIERRSVNTLQPVEEDSIGTDTGNLDFQEQHKNSVNEPSSQNEDEDETTSIQSTPSTKSTINRAFKKRQQETTSIQSTPSTKSTINRAFKKRQQRTSDSKLLEELKKRSADRTAFMRKILEDEDEVASKKCIFSVFYSMNPFLVYLKLPLMHNKLDLSEAKALLLTATALAKEYMTRWRSTVAVDGDRRQRLLTATALAKEYMTRWRSTVAVDGDRRQRLLTAPAKTYLTIGE